MPAIAAAIVLNPRVLVMRRLAPVAITLALWGVLIEGVRLAIAAF